MDIASGCGLCGADCGGNGTECKRNQHNSVCALLHDIGKIEMPKHILNKKEELTEEEIKYLRQHPIYSENILEPLADMDKLTDYVRHHHERYDGKVIRTA